MAAKKKETQAVQTVNELQTKLSSKFAVSEVQQRDGGFGKKLDYIAIDKVINRLNDTFPLSYNWEIKSVTEIKDSVVVVGTLTIKVSDDCCVVREGIGADKANAKDIDKACKTAMAEAFKKASHTLGVGLYLWDEDARLEIQQERNQQAVGSIFTKPQIDFMKTIRNTLKLDTDAKLNDLVNTSPFTELKKRADLNSGNIDKFIKWVKAFKSEELKAEVSK